MFNKSYLSAAILAATASSAIAENKSIDEEMVVTATRTPVELHKTLASVSVIDKEQIAQAQATQLIDLLSTQTGVEVSQTGTRGTSSSLSLRGTSTNHVLVLVDGVRMSSATSGAAALSQIPVSQIDRIEIVKGPRSSLYGAEAIGGVIQVFTAKGEEGINPYVEAETGSHNSQKYTAGVSGRENALGYNFAVSKESSDGIDSTRREPGSPNNDLDSYKETSVTAGIDYQLENGWTLGASGQRVAAKIGIDQVSELDRTESLNQVLTVNANGNLNDDLELHLAISQSKDESETFGGYPGVYNTKRDAAVAQLDYHLNEDHFVTLGYDFYVDKVSSTESYSATSRENEAVFVQYQGRVEDFSFVASLRQDDNEAYGKNDTETLSLGYDLTDDLILSLSYGTAFKAPTFNDLYYPSSDFVFFGKTYRYSGNADVQPEESKSYEVLLRGTEENYSWSASIYQTDIVNLIEIVDLIDTPTLTASGPGNVGKAELTGAEVSLGLTVADWNVDLGLSYVDPMNKDTNSMLRRRSRGIANVKLDRDFGKLNAAVFWQAQSYRYDGASAKDRLSGFNTVAIRGKYLVSDELTLGFKVDNLFDSQYTVVKDYNTYGRTVSVSARYNF